MNISILIDRLYSFFFNFISFLPRKSVYNTVSGVIDPQIRPLSSSASKHSPINRQIFINKNCIRHHVSFFPEVRDYRYITSIENKRCHLYILIDDN